MTKPTAGDMISFNCRPNIELAGRRPRPAALHKLSIPWGSEQRQPLRVVCVKESRELSVFCCRNVIAFQVRAMDVRRSLIPIE